MIDAWFELVADDQVRVGRDRRDRAAVRGEARLKREDGLDVLEVGQSTFQLVDQLRRAGNGADGAGTDSQLANRFLSGVDQPWMGGQPEIVVR